MDRSRGLTLLVLFAIALAIGAMTARVLSTSIEEQRLGEQRTTMIEEGRLMQAILAGKTPDDLIADDLGSRAGARVTIIDKEGVVVGDSAIAAGQIGALENHRERPEVTVAAHGDIGFSVRDSTSIADKLAYVALPLDQGRVLRLARPVSRLKGDILRVQLTAAAFATFAFLLAALAVARVDSARNQRLQTLNRALKRSPKDARALFQDNSPEAALARTIEDAIDTPNAALDDTKAEVEKQRRILESMQEGVLVLDADSNVVLLNRALREMLLLTDRVVDRPLLEVLRNSELSQLISRTVEDSAPQSTEIETQGIKPRRLLVQASPLGDTSTGIVVVFVDVTEVRRLESLRRDFVANVSHELRTPVTAIRSAAETLRSAALADPKMALKFIDIVDRNAERLGDLVEDLLDLSRIESKAYKLALEPISVAQIAGYCMSLFRERAEKKKLQLSVRVAETVRPVKADRRALEQVLTNLIDNAVKYCPEGREIAIVAEETATGVRISVRDTGQGIDAKHLPRLFERFYRVDPGRARDTGGTGLGLSIAKHLVEAMGGTIGVESTLGKGTTFHLSMPS